MQKIPPKSSITKAHATKEQKLRKAVSPNRAVFDFGGLFLLLFWAGKKVKNKIKKKRREKSPQSFRRVSTEFVLIVGNKKTIDILKTIYCLTIPLPPV